MTKVTSYQFCGQIDSFGHRKVKINIVLFTNICVCVYIYFTEKGFMTFWNPSLNYSWINRIVKIYTKAKVINLFEDEILIWECM